MYWSSSKHPPDFFGSERFVPHSWKWRLKSYFYGYKFFSIFNLSITNYLNIIVKSFRNKYIFEKFRDISKLILTWQMKHLLWKCRSPRITSSMSPSELLALIFSAQCQQVERTFLKELVILLIRWSSRFENQ